MRNGIRDESAFHKMEGEKRMAVQQRNSVVGVFHDHETAQKAVRDLRQAGFSDDQIGVMGRDHTRTGQGGDGDETDSYAAEGAATGVAAGAGLGALWGLGILAGVMPVIGPAIAGGTLAAILSSAAAGAAAAGLAGALIGMGIPKEEAEYYESEIHAGRVVVTVTAPGREDEARSILRRHNSYDFANRGSAMSSGSNVRSSSTGAFPPSQGVSSQGTMEGSTRTTHGAGHTATASHSDTCSTGTGSSSRQGMASSGNTGSVKAVDEELRVHKTPAQQTGEVNVRKEVHTEHKTIDVPVTREEVVVERRPVSGQTASAADMGSAHQEIRVPVKEEHVHVEKTPVVKEEVSVSKRKVQDTERVSETLRKEDIKVETQGNADVRDKRK